MVPTPPPLPPESIYTSCYCEENIYLLCQNFLQNPSVNSLWEIFVMFISNTDKTVALWHQKAAHLPHSPVIWDYHVILILRLRRNAATTITEYSAKRSWAYDLDTSLDLPCTWEEYLGFTFPEDLVPAYQSRFRLIHGELYIQNFASDRSHMLRRVENVAEFASNTADAEDFVYSSPPPPYPPIHGPSAAERGTTNNLMERYVAMLDDSEDLYGCVRDRSGISRFFEGGDVD
ncbi:hypothetical protein BDN70DRAFT_881282 [Pholiota conissans]|uniref:Protein N-terminal glutamine amidohydrolase n=1 Tax=Pholiota conissans TaxID=109636 RepID=A0A9P5YXA6_9AGAR|nr:hypothetical protein BDN70DRAFT_881282 [Pholiota conissans]